VQSLKVISRTSVMQYKGAHQPLKQIAADLGADAIVEGSALQVGDRVRITAQLIATATDTHLWGGDFAREMKDVLSLQREIARAIARETGAKLQTTEQRRLDHSGPQVNPQAVAIYLQGLYQFNRSDVKRAVDLAHEAIRLDPNLAAAYELLGMSLE